MTALEIAVLLRGYSFNFESESELQAGIAAALAGAGLEAHAEVDLGNGVDRIDFLVGTVGIEVKTQGTLSALTRQLHRYALRPGIDELLVVTSRSRLANLPATLNGKPLVVVTLNLL